MYRGAPGPNPVVPALMVGGIVASAAIAAREYAQAAADQRATMATVAEWQTALDDAREIARRAAEVANKMAAHAMALEHEVILLRRQVSARDAALKAMRHG